MAASVSDAGKTAKKSDNTAKSQNSKKTSGKSSGGGTSAVAAAFKNKKVRIAVVAAVSFILILAIVLGAVFGAKSCNTVKGPTLGNAAPVILPSQSVMGDKPAGALNASNDPIISADDKVSGETYDNPYATTTAVGFSGSVKGTVARVKPVADIKNEGLPAYPTYGSTLKDVVGSGDDKADARTALINESDYMCAQGTHNNSGNGGNGEGTYTWMDKDGYLYSGTVAAPVQAVNSDGTRRQLYKHTSAVGMYLGDVNDDEPGIIKEVTVRPRLYGSYSVTGVYAPAGEVIKIEISEADMNATGGLTVHIGQALYNGQANNIWTAKGQMQRFPIILNTMRVTKDTATLENGIYTAYVGSFVGGPLYIRNTNVTFTATISGGVKYSHFILGYTTKEEFEETRSTASAPYFDLEVWNFGVLHSGPKRYAQNFSYDDLYKAAILWEKISSVTTTGSSQGIVFLYDPFVAAGAAVAFPGRSSVNCPLGWMSNSLNYNGIVTSSAWGNLHEYHHNFQGYGVGNGGEVTNNGMTLVSYALFTKISAARGISGYGSAGLGGWNSYTCATWALNEVLKIQDGGTPSNGKQGLTLYSTLLHNFGANNYIQAKVRQQSKSYGQNYSGYLKGWQDVTHNDMTYYFKDVLKGIDAAKANELRNPDYPVFVPVSSVYQTGRSYLYDGEKKYFKTMQPYIIPYGDPFEIDLGKYTAPGGQYASGSVVIPKGFEYRIKSITQPEHGKIETIDNYRFKFTPDENLHSGQIIATLEIIKTDGAFKVDDIDLVLEFEQSHETNKTTLTRTTYTYTADKMYTDAQAAYTAGYKGYETVEESDHKNPVQNCNTDIWFYPDTPENRQKYPNAPESFFVHKDTIIELSGKLYFDEAGDYRIYLRGRMNCAMYYSTDGGKTYLAGPTIKDTAAVSNSANFRPTDSNTYVDLKKVEEHSWVYFKSVLIVQPTPVVSYIGLGTAKWTEPMFTMVEKYYDAAGNEVDAGSPDAVRHETHYYDYQGHEVTEEEATNAKPIAPTQASYANAYRSNYEFPSNSGFTTEYFYTRKYTYNYTGDETFVTAKQTCVDSQYQPWDNTPTHALSNLFDDDDSNFIHTNRTAISESNPFMVTVKFDTEVTASRLTFRGSSASANYATYLPKKFKIWVSDDGNDWTLVSDVQNSSASNLKVIANFDDFHTFKFYKVEITQTHARNNLGYLALSKIELSSLLALQGGRQFSPDEDSFAFTGTWNVQQAYSTFGHVYVGSTGAEMSFKFNGTRLALFSSALHGKNFEVYIDGKKVDSIDMSAAEIEKGLSFLSDKLNNVTHTVKIKCTGKANIDSVVIFD